MNGYQVLVCLGIVGVSCYCFGIVRGWDDNERCEARALAAEAEVARLCATLPADFLRPMSCTDRRPLYDYHDGPTSWLDVDALPVLDPESAS